MAAAKKGENALEDAALVASTHQNFSHLYSLDIYGQTAPMRIHKKDKRHTKAIPSKLFGPIDYKINFFLI
jgi:hypothetical protein